MTYLSYYPKMQIVYFICNKLSVDLHNSQTVLHLPLSN